MLALTQEYNGSTLGVLALNRIATYDVGGDDATGEVLSDHAVISAVLS